MDVGAFLDAAEPSTTPASSNMCRRCRSGRDSWRSRVNHCRQSCNACWRSGESNGSTPTRWPCWSWPAPAATSSSAAPPAARRSATTCRFWKRRSPTRGGRCICSRPKGAAQDQLKGLLELLVESRVQPADQPGVFDGDTPTAQRRRIQAEANLVLSNPDMLHASILPYHPKWGRFFSQLRYIVLDEVHTYRGILGANVPACSDGSRRICENYGSRPVVPGSQRHDRQSGRAGRPLDRPRRRGGRRRRGPARPQVFRPLESLAAGQDRLARRSASDDAVTLMAEAMPAAQALAFTRTRQAAELVHRYVKKSWRNSARRWPIRCGLIAADTCPTSAAQIEQACSPEAAPAWRPPTRWSWASTSVRWTWRCWPAIPEPSPAPGEQAGRSGRRREESLAILLAGNDPVDQYLWRHPDYFFLTNAGARSGRPGKPVRFGQPSEGGRLRAAAGRKRRRDVWAAGRADCRSSCAATGELAEVGGRSTRGLGRIPRRAVSLRHMSDNTFSIVLLQAGLVHRAVSRDSGSRTK